MMSLREQMQQLIEKKGIAIGKLSRLADVHYETISQFLKGESEMTAANLDKCFKALRSYEPPADVASSNEEGNPNTKELGSQSKS